ncbi:MAG: radical SAM protein [Clostridia bacterium]|nr:radical SAM protein [Clostridia bacterium]
MRKNVIDDKKVVRYESFGGIVGLNNPPTLVFVDREFMKEMGYESSELWQQQRNYLSAPTEVHFNITNACPMSCRHCTSDSGSRSSGDLSNEDIKKAIDVLSEMKVFHIAFGGGELFERTDAIDIAEYASSKGIVPNATTNGYYITTPLAEKCKVFGQINISIDGIGSKYGVIRGVDSFEYADRAAKLLVEAGVNTGINCMVTNANFDDLEEVVAYAADIGMKEVLFLRLKPSGRAKAIYDKYKLTQEQNKLFYRSLMRMARKYKINLQVDCSFIPHICYHNPPEKVMKLLGIEGCEGGNVLLGVRHDGLINACSHYPSYYENIHKLPHMWNEHEHFKQFRERHITDETCIKCNYFKLCRGGCPLFSEFITGDFNAPDPECPIIRQRQL